MSNQRTELVFILDRSGSMYGLEADTVGGFNSTLTDNQRLPGECSVTTILFNQEVKLLHDRLPIQAVRPMQCSDYVPAGMTALLDAVGYGMDKIEAVQKALAPEYRAAHVQFVIMTDGMENASSRYTRQSIRDRITRARSELKWDFIFLGANIDAASAAEEIGISADRSVNAIADGMGVRAQYRSVTKATLGLRMDCPQMCQTWASEVEDDCVRRQL